MKSTKKIRNRVDNQLFAGFCQQDNCSENLIDLKNDPIFYVK